MHGSYTQYLMNQAAAEADAKRKIGMMERGEIPVECPFCHWPKVTNISTGTGTRIQTEKGTFDRTYYACRNTACLGRFHIDRRVQKGENSN